MMVKHLLIERKPEIDGFFKRIEHENTITFAFFDKDVWHDFLAFFKIIWNFPSPKVIRNYLLDEIFETKMV